MDIVRIGGEYDRVRIGCDRIEEVDERIGDVEEVCDIGDCPLTVAETPASHEIVDVFSSGLDVVLVKLGCETDGIVDLKTGVLDAIGHEIALGETDEFDDLKTDRFCDTGVNGREDEIGVEVGTAV